ncbi:MAG: type II toxin-antitoxin system VapC family toxin [Oscillatoria sp. SIO1A7]|nr:type II toxin-antitoxin system VapC family toxin [Oscillatoria sp. SIO1A7]
MSKAIVLDSGVLGMLTNPKTSSDDCEKCKIWFRSLRSSGYKMMLPEIADYEVRRELIRAGKSAGIMRLNEFKNFAIYLPITTEVMLLAAELWAEARRLGRPTADPKALDGDVILAAQARLVATVGNEVVVATTNVRHLSLFVDAREWQLIK